MNYRSVQRAYNTVIDDLHFDESYMAVRDGLLEYNMFIKEYAHRIVKLTMLRAYRTFDNKEYEQCYNYAIKLLGGLK